MPQNSVKQVMSAAMSKIWSGTWFVKPEAIWKVPSMALFMSMKLIKLLLPPTCLVLMYPGPVSSAPF
jgi:hypothetical protein